MTEVHRHAIPLPARSALRQIMDDIQDEPSFPDVLLSAPLLLYDALVALDATHPDLFEIFGSTTLDWIMETIAISTYSLMDSANDRAHQVQKDRQDG